MDSWLDTSSLVLLVLTHTAQLHNLGNCTELCHPLTPKKISAGGWSAIRVWRGGWDEGLCPPVLCKGYAQLLAGSWRVHSPVRGRVSWEPSTRWLCKDEFSLVTRGLARSIVPLLPMALTPHSWCDPPAPLLPSPPQSTGRQSWLPAGAAGRAL